MILSELLSQLGEPVFSDQQAPHVPVTGVTATLDNVQVGSVFVAYRGVSVDAHQFIPEAVRRGAIAVIAERKPAASISYLLVADGRAALSAALSRFYDHPSQRFPVYAVTGTNGKSTIHWLLFHALNELLGKTLRIGTLGVYCEGFPTTTGPTTTPNAEELQKLFAQFRDTDGKAVVMEVSSHGLAQRRVADVSFAGAIFTNLAPDHLNFHRDMEDYFQAKSSLFTLLEGEASRVQRRLPAIVCSDDSYGQRLAESLSRSHLSVVTYGENPGCDIRMVDFSQTLQGSQFTLVFGGERYLIHSSLIGRYNALNIAGAFALLVSEGFEPHRVRELLQSCPHVPGRLEPLTAPKGTVFVDYAHTGDGLTNALGAVRELCRGKLWCLFGCGGGKDPGKRLLMGKAAKDFADKVVLTDDNPKNEDPDKIVQDILASGVSPVFIEHDRSKAIQQTLSLLEQGDVLVVAGKGHEDYQIVGEKVSHFSDVEEVRAAVSLLESKSSGGH